MNSSKRGAVYGFKLQSLDLVRRGGSLGPGSLSHGVRPSLTTPGPPLPAAGHQVH